MIKYIRDKAHCKHEFNSENYYTKTEMDTTLTQMYNDLVKPNEVYTKSDYEKLTISLTMPSGSNVRGTSKEYPEGYNFQNSIVIATEFHRTNTDSPAYYFLNPQLKLQASSASNIMMVNLQLDSAVSEESTYEINIYLRKID